MITYIFAFTLLVRASHSWMLQTTREHVQLDEASNVSLHCHNDNQSINAPWMKNVFSLTISKDGSWLAMAQGANNAWVRSDKRSEISAVGHANLVNDSYLSLTWNQVSKDTIGRYKCAISGIDGRATVLVHTNTVAITELQSGTVKPPQLNASKTWPGGKYALLKPHLGCPDPTWTEGFIKIHAESTYTRHYYSHYSRPNHLAMPVLTSEYDRSSKYERKFVYIRTCKHINENDDGPEWPKGNYCVHRVEGSCPKGFNENAINIDTENYLTATEYVNPPDVTYSSNGDLQLYFCCRKDGPFKHFMTLPAHKTFYLYKNGGGCQWVNNMYTTKEYLTIDTNNLDDVSLDFCYYKKFSYVH